MLSASVVMFGCSAVEQAAEPADSLQSQAQTAQPDRAHLEELFWSRLDESRTNFVEEDVVFMTDMIVHHAQAIIMSRLAPENEASGQIQRLAARILAAQEDEIALMQKWLRDRSQPVPVVHFDGIVMHVMTEMPGQDLSAHHPADHHEGHHNNEIPNHSDDHSMHGDHHGHGGMHMDHDHHDMPGMLTQEQLEELAAATGDEFDILFLRFMIEHHQGAVWMVDQLFAADGAAVDLESYRLAVDIYAEQVTEIQLMNLMLEERGEEPVGPLQVNGHGGHENHDEHQHHMHNEHNSHSGHGSNSN